MRDAISLLITVTAYSVCFGVGFTLGVKLILKWLGSDGTLLGIHVHWHNHAKED